ncbi:MAG: hypothetical protein LBK77_07530 [Spirochaetaceae bacterium]|nr:hypothetical protein [Spirochaetaceae bacterium]
MRFRKHRRPHLDDGKRRSPIRRLYRRGAGIPGGNFHRPPVLVGNRKEPQILVDIGEFNGGGDTRFCEWFAEEVKVAAVPGSSFFREPVNHLIRFHFAKKEETLIAAAR